MISISKDLKTIEEQVLAFKQEYEKTVSGAIQQNPDITVLSRKPSCFILPFSKLSNECWSPSYYDFLMQADIIIAAIRQLPLDRIEKYLQFVIHSGQLPRGTCIKDQDGKILYSGSYEFKVNPRVVEKLKEIVV